MSIRELRTRMLVMEPLRLTHAERMFAGLCDSRAYKFLPEDPPESVFGLVTQYARMAMGMSPDGDEVWYNWMLRLRWTENYAGYVQATVIPAERAVLVAYHIFPAFWRRHFGKESVAAMLGEVQEKHELREARAYIDTRNAASIGLVESLGFELRDTIIRAGKIRGRYSDEFFYVKRLAGKPVARAE